MTSRRILAAVAVLCAIVAPAHAQKTKAAINSEIASQFPNNTVAAITPLNLRNITGDIVNSIMPTAPVVSGNLICFDGTTGLLKDCGVGPGNLSSIAAFSMLANPTSTSAAPIAAQIGFLHSKDFGAKGDAQIGTFTVSIGSGANALTVAGGSFTVADQGKLIFVNGAGAAGGTLFTTITTVNSATSLTLGANASTTLTTSSQTIGWGTNDTASLQNWLNACVAARNYCFLDASNYAVNADLSVTAAIAITGAVDSNSILIAFAAAPNLLSINTSASGGSVSNISMQSFATMTGGTGFFLQGSSQYWKFDNIFTTGLITAATISTGNNWFITRSVFGCTSVCLNLDGTGQNGGSADSSISDTIFSFTAGTGIRMINTAGLKITNSKIISSTSGSLGITWTGTASCTSCSDLAISNTSVEVQTAGIRMTKGAATQMTNVAIAGGEFSAAQPFDFSDTNTGWLANLSINGTTSASSNGSYVLSVGGANGFNISGNSFQGFGSTTNGILVGSAATGCVIGGPNAFIGSITAPLTDSSNKCLTTAALIPFNGGGAGVPQASTEFTLTTINANEQAAQAICPRAGVFSNLYASASAMPVAQTLTATFRVANADTTLTCQVVNGTLNCSDKTHLAACSAGQTYSLKLVTSATTGTVNFWGGVQFQ